ncbi:hypothetical protein [Chitinophaga sedimenti]|nr:hypothetical protein [Chitinophaga sedimenti]
MKRISIEGCDTGSYNLLTLPGGHDYDGNVASVAAMAAKAMR